MTSRDFCYWLQGAFEVHRDSNNGEPSPLTAKNVAVIQAHLNLVFKHEIDPSFGGPEKQAELNKIHGGNSHLTNNKTSNSDTLIRC